MANKLGLYDIKKLKEARELINYVYEYNYKSQSDPLSKKLNTVLTKLDNIIKNEKEE